MSILFTSVPQKILKQSILGSSTTFSINNIKGWDGEDLEAADFGTVGYGAFMSADKTRLEFFEWDASTIAASVINFNKRGLQFDGDLTTEVTANKLDWTANETYVMLGADTSQHFQWLKEYIDGIAIAGSPDMDTTTKGIAQEATQAEVDAKTGAGSTAARLAVNPSTLRATKYNDYVADAVGTDSYAITVDPAITAYAAGQEFTFKAGTANTGACTLNVCGLGAKDIKKDVSTDLATGDILANQIVKVIYDGTNMQMVSKAPSLNNKIVYTSGVNTWTKKDGLKWIKVEMWGGGGGGTSSIQNRVLNSGSGGGAYNMKEFLAADLTSTVTATVGAGGSPGQTGGTSSFGSYLYAYGGGPAIIAYSNGETYEYVSGGGGQLSAGLVGYVSASKSSTAGSPGFPVVGDGSYAEFGSLVETKNGIWGGGAGSNNGNKAGNSLYGGGGGGYKTAESAGESVFGGNGGAGATDGGVAGDGAIPGGGGGTHYDTSVSGTAGSGGRGEIRITEYY